MKNRKTDWGQAIAFALFMCELVFLVAVIAALLAPLVARGEGTTAYEGGVLYLVTVDDYCNVRSSADKDSRDLGDIDGGTLVVGHEYSQGWILVDVNFEAAQGWIRADLLTLSAREGSNDFALGKYKNTSGGRVWVRTDPDGAKVAQLQSGKSVTVLRWLESEGKTWAYTKRGYIDGSYLTYAGTGPAAGRQKGDADIEYQVEED